MVKKSDRKKKPYQILWHIIKVTHFTKFILSFLCYLFIAAVILLFTEPAISLFHHLFGAGFCLPPYSKSPQSPTDSQKREGHKEPE